MTGHARSKPWRVVRQNGSSETEMCTHRWERMAERCARRLSAKDNRFGIFYTVRAAAEVSS